MANESFIFFGRCFKIVNRKCPGVSGGFNEQSSKFAPAKRKTILNIYYFLALSHRPLRGFLACPGIQRGRYLEVTWTMELQGKLESLPIRNHQNVSHIAMNHRHLQPKDGHVWQHESATLLGHAMCSWYTPECMVLFGQAPRAAAPRLAHFLPADRSLLGAWGACENRKSQKPSTLAL